MHNSKSLFIVKIILFIFLFILIEKVVAFAVVPSTLYTRLTMHEMYEQDNIDYIFVGASQAYKSFDPRIFDAELKINSMNLGSTSQSILDGYYILKEMFQYYKPKRVLYSIPSDYCLVRNLDRNLNRFSTLLMYNQMKPSMVKLEYLFDTITLSNIQDFLFNSYVYRSNAKNAYKNLKYKLSDDYQNYSYNTYALGVLDNEEQYYVGKGFVHNIRKYDEGNLGKFPTAVRSELHIDENLEYLYKTYELCKDNGAELIIISPPRPFVVLYETQNYEKLYTELKEFSEEFNITFWSFEYAKSDLLKNMDSNYYDGIHMSIEGAEKFSYAVVDLLKRYDAFELIESDWFYSSFDELDNDIDVVLNTWYDYEIVKGKLFITANSNHGKNVTPEYRFSYKEKDTENYIPLQDYSPKSTISLSMDDMVDATIRVEARATGSNLTYEQCFEQILN